MAKSAPVYVLDSFAVLAHFQAESGGERVLRLLEEAGTGAVSLVISLINVGEVAYLGKRAHCRAGDRRSRVQASQGFRSSILAGRIEMTECPLSKL